MSAGDAAIALVFRVLEAPGPDDADKIAAFGAEHGLQIFLQTGGLDTVRPMRPDYPPLTYAVDGGRVVIEFGPVDFIQINREINASMVTAALELLLPTDSDTALDLFSGFGNAARGCNGADALDASVLMMPLVGFLPATDPRIVGTVAAIQRNLMDNGLVRRYSTETPGVDGLPPGEGAFLPCMFWLADNLTMMGRYDEANAIFERLIGLCNDVGLLSEEYDPRGKRQLGNFPQAFTHVFLINTAHNLSRSKGPAHERAKS